MTHRMPLGALRGRLHRQPAMCPVRHAPRRRADLPPPMHSPPRVCGSLHLNRATWVCIVTCAIPALVNSHCVLASTTVGSGASLVTSPHRALPLPPMPPLEATCWRLASRTVSSLRRIAYTVLRVPRLSRGLPELTNLGATITSGSLPHVRKLSMLIELLRPRVWLSCDRGSLSL